jgi:hypothetical protein
MGALLKALSNREWTFPGFAVPPVFRRLRRQLEGRKAATYSSLEEQVFSFRRKPPLHSQSFPEEVR